MAAFIRQYAEIIPTTTCSQIIARFEGDARKTRSPATLRIDEFPQWSDVTALVLDAVSRVTHRYVEDCPTFGGSHTRVRPTSLIVVRHDPQDATPWRAPTAIRPRPIVVVVGFLSAGDGAIEFEAQADRVVPAPGMVAVFPSDFEYVCRDAQATSPRYTIATSLTWVDEGARG